MNVFNIQLPVVANGGQDNTAVIQSICIQIAEIAGGLTAHPAQGMWLDASGLLVRDDVINVVTFCDDAALARLRSFVEMWRIALVQDALVTAVWPASVEFVSG